MSSVKDNMNQLNTEVKSDLEGDNMNQSNNEIKFGKYVCWQNDTRYSYIVLNSDFTYQFGVYILSHTPKGEYDIVDGKVVLHGIMSDFVLEIHDDDDVLEITDHKNKEFNGRLYIYEK